VRSICPALNCWRICRRNRLVRRLAICFFNSHSQTNRCPLVEGFRRPSLRSGLLNPSTKGQFQQSHHLSPFELAAVPFCSRPDSETARLT